MSALTNEMRMSEEKKYQQHNPCCYCSKTITCAIDCLARIGFDNVITAKLADCISRKRENSEWLSDLIGNSTKYGLPIGV